MKKRLTLLDIATLGMFGWTFFCCLVNALMAWEWGLTAAAGALVTLVPTATVDFIVHRARRRRDSVGAER